MKRHIQTILGDPERGDPERGDGHNSEGRPGDCWRTVIACMIDAKRPEDVPHFVEQHEHGHGHWYLLTVDYLRDRLGDEVELPWVDGGIDLVEDPKVYMLASGPSPRGSFQHVVIVDQAGNLVHDPHPSGAGITAITQVFWIGGIK